MYKVNTGRTEGRNSNSIIIEEDINNLLSIMYRTSRQIREEIELLYNTIDPKEIQGLFYPTVVEYTLFSGTYIQNMLKDKTHIY